MLKSFLGLESETASPPPPPSWSAASGFVAAEEIVVGVGFFTFCETVEDFLTAVLGLLIVTEVGPLILAKLVADDAAIGGAGRRRELGATGMLVAVVAATKELMTAGLFVTGKSFRDGVASRGRLPMGLGVIGNFVTFLEAAEVTGLAPDKDEIVIGVFGGSRALGSLIVATVEITVVGMRRIGVLEMGVSFLVDTPMGGMEGGIFPGTAANLGCLGAGKAEGDCGSAGLFEPPCEELGLFFAGSEAASSFFGSLISFGMMGFLPNSCNDDLGARSP